MRKELGLVLDTCNAVQMDRHDSGYGESLTSAKMTDISQEAPEESLNFQDQQSIGVVLTSSGRSSIRPQTLSRPSSINPSSHRASNSQSRRSSFIINNPASGHSRRPQLRNSSFGSDYSRPRAEDLFVAHRRSKQIFPSSTGMQSPLRIEPQRRFTSPNPPNSSRASTSSIEDSSSTRLNTLPQYTNFVPAANMDWTLPSTRLREYRKIDRSCQGVRGLWRRFAPHWCCKNKRLSFFEVDKGDTGSVRRYRMNLSKNQTAVKITRKDIEEEEAPPSTSKLRRTWGHFASKNWSTNQLDAKHIHN